MNKGVRFWIVVLAALMAVPLAVSAAPRKAHSVFLGAARKVPYSKAADPAGAAPGENELTIRPLLVDDVRKEWTTGEAHDLTDRSFVVRRAIKVNDALPSDKPVPAGQPGHGDKSGPSDKSGPGDKPGSGSKSATGDKPSSTGSAGQWVWQRGPWLLVDRVTGHITALKLPHYDPGVSQVVWFRDYAAYCGVTASGKSLYAVVAQVAARKPLLAKKLSSFDAESHPEPVCGPAEWQREPMRISFHPTGKEQVGFEIVPGSAVLVEEAGDEPETSKQ
jgi:hypothetical protein